MKNIILASLIFPLVIACNRTDVEYSDITTFRFEDKPAESINLSEISSSIRYIPARSGF